MAYNVKDMWQIRERMLRVAAGMGGTDEPPHVTIARARAFTEWVIGGGWQHQFDGTYITTNVMYPWQYPMEVDKFATVKGVIE